MEEQMNILLDAFAPTDHPYPDEKLNELFEAAVERAKSEVAGSSDDIGMTVMADTYSPLLGNGHMMGGSPVMPSFIPPHHVFRMIGENCGKESRSFPLAVCVSADVTSGKTPDGMSDDQADEWRHQMPDDISEWPKELIREAVIVSMVANQNRSRVAVINYTRQDDGTRSLGDIEYPDKYENILIPILVVSWILGYVKAVAR